MDEQYKKTSTNLVHGVKIVLEGCYTDCAEIVVKYVDEGVEEGKCDERIRWWIIFSVGAGRTKRVVKLSMKEEH